MQESSAAGAGDGAAGASSSSAPDGSAPGLVQLDIGPSEQQQPVPITGATVVWPPEGGVRLEGISAARLLALALAGAGAGGG